MSDGFRRVKVLVHIEKDRDDYPSSVEIESLWGIARHEGIEIDNIPFYARGIALGDIVQVREESDGGLEFVRVLRRGGHSTYRVLLLDKRADEPLRTMEEMNSLGLSVEQDLDCLLAVDVPPDVPVEEIENLFRQGIHSGRWEVEEGHKADRNEG